MWTWSYLDALFTGFLKPLTLEQIEKKFEEMKRRCPVTDTKDMSRTEKEKLYAYLEQLYPLKLQHDAKSLTEFYETKPELVHIYQESAHLPKILRKCLEGSKFTEGTTYNLKNLLKSVDDWMDKKRKDNVKNIGDMDRLLSPKATIKRFYHYQAKVVLNSNSKFNIVF